MVLENKVVDILEDVITTTVEKVLNCQERMRSTRNHGVILLCD